MLIDKAEIERRIPHAGAMNLLDSVIEWNADRRFAAARQAIAIWPKSTARRGQALRHQRRGICLPGHGGPRRAIRHGRGQATRRLSRELA